MVQVNSKETEGIRGVTVQITTREGICYILLVIMKDRDVIYIHMPDDTNEATSMDTETRDNLHKIAYSVAMAS